MANPDGPEGDFEPPREGEPLYDLWTRGWRPMNHAPLNDEVEAHIERCFGPTWRVLHEHLSKHVHLDVNVILPSHGRDFTTYVTSGMSDLPMRTPDGVDPLLWSRAELVMGLPGFPEDHAGHYMISELRQVARYPHMFDTWLCRGHTVQSHEEGPIAEDTRLTAHILGPPIATPLPEVTDALELELEDGGLVHFFSLVPIYEEELAFKLSKGSDALSKKFGRIDLTEVYRPDRVNAVTSTRGGRFRFRLMAP